MAEKFLEPNVPLKKIDKETGDTLYIYPQTTASQVKMDEDGTRLSTILNENILYLGNTEDGGAEVINADTLGGRPASYYTPAYNLLDNSDFRNPVNQRGAKGAYGAWGGYTIDRWAAYSEGATISLSNQGLTLTNGIFQPISAETMARYNGKPMTFAVKINGTVYVGSGVFKQNNAWTQIFYLTTPYGNIHFEVENDNMAFCCIICNTQAVIEWAALYEGEYTAATLPEYMPKGYAHELAECKRYFQRFVNIGLPVLCWGTNADQACVTFSTQTNFVKAPDVTLETPVILMDSTGTSKALSNYYLLNYNANSGSVRVRLKSSDSWTKGSGVYVGTATFSADL